MLRLVEREALLVVVVVVFGRGGRVNWAPTVEILVCVDSALHRARTSGGGEGRDQRRQPGEGTTGRISLGASESNAVQQ